jgi:hypothetical protein
MRRKHEVLGLGTKAGAAMKTSEVLRRAAARISDSFTLRGDYYCCNAIWHAGDRDFHAAKRAADLFGHLFDDHHIGSGRSWWNSTKDGNADQEARRCALLFAALIAEDEESK